MERNLERLAFLLRCFRQIVPQPGSTWDPIRLRRFQCWLRDDVGPFLDEHSRRPRFRAQALWAMATLRPGAQTAERELVDRVDTALVGHAQSLRGLARRPQIRGQLEASAVQDVVSEEVICVGGDNVQVVHRTTASVNELPVLLAQLESIGSRCWHDLVCVEDYLEPIGGWLEDRGGRGQAGEFVVSLNPELHPGGDFISRCLCWRVEVLAEVLRAFRHLCGQVCGQPGARCPRGWQALEQDAQELSALTRQLRQACLEGPGQPLRDACVLLTQVHAALAPQAELGWLGLPENIVRHGADVIGHRLLKSRDPELLERLAVSLSELQGLYAEGDVEQTALEEAIARGKLVVVRSSQQVYWEGNLLEVRWASYRALWAFLEKLVEKGRRGATVEQRDLYSQPVAESTLGTTLMRLKKLVPASLWKQIVPTRDPRGYRLDIERQQLYRF